MRAGLVLGLGVLALFVGACERGPQPWDLDPAVVNAEYPPADPGPAAEAVTAFAFDLYKELAPQQENLCFSPLGIAMVLAAVENGASGATREEMRTVLHMKPDVDYNPGFGTFLRALNGGGHFWKGHVANAVWVQEGFDFEQPFIDTLNKHYLAPVISVDFQQQPRRAARSMNAWFDDHGLDAQIASGDAITSLTRLGVTNALGVDLPWALPFDETGTERAPFHVTPEETVTVRMMSKSGEYVVYRDDEVQCLILGYMAPFELLVLLPPEGQPLSEFEQSLDVDDVMRWRLAAEKRDLAVYLPRFTSETELDLRAPLEQLGAKTSLVEGAADYSRLSSGLWLDLVRHACHIEVNEYGTYISSGTLSQFTLGILETDNVFRVDRPFVYLVRQYHTGAIVAMGRLVRPS